MIRFIPVKEYRESHLPQGLPAVALDDCGERMRPGGQVINIVKEHVCVLSFEDGFSCGNDAAVEIAVAAAGSGISMPEVREGAVILRAAQDGLLRIDEETLGSLNGMGAVRLNTLRNNRHVRKGQVVAGVRITSRVAGECGMQGIEKACHKPRPIIDVWPFKQFRVGVAVAGAEVPGGRVKAVINPILQDKFIDLGSVVVRQESVSGGIGASRAVLRRLIDQAVEMIVWVGGEGVAPNNLMAAAIRDMGGKAAACGTQAMPGGVPLCYWIGAIPVLRLPLTVLHSRMSIFDLIVPRLLAGVAVGPADLTADFAVDFATSGRNCPCCSSP